MNKYKQSLRSDDLKQSLRLRLKQSLRSDDLKQSFPFDDAKRRQIKKELKNKKELAVCAEQLGVVGDATRLKICYLLCRHPELNVSDMAKILGTSVSVVSHSVKKLLELELVTRRKEAQTVYYSLRNNEFTKTLKDFIT